jgi:hypothetical protein
MSDETKAERERCLRIVEMTMIEAPEESQHALIRCANMIRNGQEPITFREQVEPPGK